MNPNQTFRLAVAAVFAVVLPIALYHRIRAHTGEKLDRRQEGLFVLLTLRPIAGVGMLGLIAYFINPAWMEWSSVPLPVWARWMGIGVGVLGVGLWIWSFRTLGKNLTDTVVTRREHTLVTGGPYHWVRHPFYDAAALFLLGNCVAAANWFLFSCCALAIALLVVRTSTEEAKLLERFGAAYRDYKERTGRFLPRWRGLTSP